MSFRSIALSSSQFVFVFSLLLRSAVQRGTCPQGLRTRAAQNAPTGAGCFVVTFFSFLCLSYRFFVFVFCCRVYCTDRDPVSCLSLGHMLAHLPIQNFHVKRSTYPERARALLPSAQLCRLAPTNFLAGFVFGLTLHGGRYASDWVSPRRCLGNCWGPRSLPCEPRRLLRVLCGICFPLGGVLLAVEVNRPIVLNR